MTTRTRPIVGEGVHREIDGGVLSVDRPLPFICVVRSGDDIAGLVAGQGSYLVGDDVSDVLVGVVRELTDRFGSVLVLELWSGSETFRVHASGDDSASTTVACLREALGEIGPVEVVVTQTPAPPGMGPVLSHDDVRKAGCVFLGLEVPDVYTDAESGERLPLVYRELQRDLQTALQRSFFEFATVQTSLEVKDFRALGRSAVTDAAKAADRALVKIAEELDFLLSVTPVNADEAWAQFEEGREPHFHYRPLRVDPDELKRRLFEIDVEAVDDPTLAALFRDKRHELDRQATMLESRDSPAFLGGSMQVYGGVSDELHTFATEVLSRVREAASDGDGAVVDAATLAARVREELDVYRALYPALRSRVEVRDDVPAILVDSGDVLIGSQLSMAAERIEALVAHEVGTHVVTHANGAAQPITLLQVGLPGYEETQEGLATLAEYLVGGLKPRRLATIAARVIAVRTVLDGATCSETCRVLSEEWGFTPHAAFSVAMRVHRCGGLTKDAIYLRGLSGVLTYLGGGGDLEPLLVGKLPLEDVGVVEELLWRGVLRPAVLRPRWMDALSRLDGIETVSDLTDEVCG